jgi:opacity protein-like surface antigen
MKKSLLSFALLSGCHPVCAEVYNGFYIGESAGYHQRNLEASTSVTSTSKEAYTTKNAAQHLNGATVNVLMGFGKLISSYYLGSELSLQHNTNNKDKTYSTPIPNKPDRGVNIEHNKGPSIKAALKVGTVQGPFMFYVKPGIEISKEYLKVHYLDLHSNSNKRTKYQITTNCGFEKKISDSVTAHLEYCWSYGTRNSHTLKDKYHSDCEHTVSINSLEHCVKVGFSYYIN